MTPNTEKWILAGFWIAVLTSLIFGHWIPAVVAAAAGVVFQERGRFTARGRLRVRAKPHHATVHENHENSVQANLPQPIDPGAENSHTEAALALDLTRLHALVEDERQAEALAHGKLTRHPESSNTAILHQRTGPHLNELSAKALSDVGALTTIEQWKSMSPSEREAFIARRDALSSIKHPDGTISGGDTLTEASSEVSQTDPRTST